MPDTVLTVEFTGFVILIVTSFVGALTWIHRQSKAIAEQVADKVNDNLEKAVTENSNRIARVEEDLKRAGDDLDHHKKNQSQVRDAINRRQTKFEDEVRSELGKLSSSLLQISGDINHEHELRKAQDAHKLATMQDIKTQLEKQERQTAQWIDQIATSLREVTTRKAD